jgi:hypothetical protein
MFELKDRVAADSATDLDDSATIKFALTALGDYDDTETGLSPYTDNQLFHSIQSFQQKNDLKVDGIINKDGPTQAKIKEKLARDEKAGNVFNDFIQNRRDMMETGFIGGDKYFHCKANYQAAKRGWLGKAAGLVLNAGREAYGLAKGDGIKDMHEDMQANAYGYRAAVSGKYETAEEACAIFRPKGLDDKY